MPDLTPPRSTEPFPEYCCAILNDERGRFVFERRPPDARHAAGLLTCFGGRREAGETPAACIRRELREELGVDVGEVTLRVRLLDKPGGRVIAWFYSTSQPVPPTARALHPGAEIVRLTEYELAMAPLSPWHRAAIDGFRGGLDRVHVDTA